MGWIYAVLKYTVLAVEHSPFDAKYEIVLWLVIEVKGISFRLETIGCHCGDDHSVLVLIILRSGSDGKLVRRGIPKDGHG